MKPIHVTFIVLTIMILLVGKCSHAVYTSVSEGFENFPEYAKKEVMYKKYNSLLSSIDEAVKQSNSYLSLAANLEKIAKPDDVIYFSLQKNQPKTLDKTEAIDIIKRFKGASISKVLINGTGYGQVDEKSITVIEYPINQYDIKSCLIYFEDKRASSQPSK